MHLQCFGEAPREPGETAPLPCSLLDRHPFDQRLQDEPLMLRADNRELGRFPMLDGLALTAPAG